MNNKGNVISEWYNVIYYACNTITIMDAGISLVTVKTPLWLCDSRAWDLDSSCKTYDYITHTYFSKNINSNALNTV